MSINAAFLAFVAVLALADILGPGHQWDGLAAATAWFLFCRWLGPRGWRMLLAASLALSVAIAALAVAQMWWMSRARGPFGSPNWLGAYAVLMFFLAVAAPVGDRSVATLLLLGSKDGSARRLEYRHLAAAANLLTLALSQSRGALLALGAGLLVHFGPRRPYAVAFWSTSVLAAVLLIRPGNEEARWNIWWTGLQVAAGHPWLGWGQGGVGIPGTPGFYNVPLDALIWGGMPAVVAGVAVCIVAWKSTVSTWAHTFLAAWFVQGLFLSGTPATWILLIAVLAHLSVRCGRGREDVADRAGLIDGHEILHPVRRGLKRPRTKKLQLALLGGGEAHPAQDVLVDLPDDVGRIDRAGDRCGTGHHADGQGTSEEETGEAGADRVAVHGALQG
jgi:hypothetical protein